MKRITLVAVVLFMSTACTGGMEAAKISLSMAKASLKLADVGIAEADRANQTECLKKDPAQGDVYKKCRAKMEKTKVLYQVSRQVAANSFSAATASILAYEAKKTGKPMDVWVLIRNGACVVLSVMGYVPEKYKKPIQSYINLAVTGLNCSK